MSVYIWIRLLSDLLGKVGIHYRQNLVVPTNDLLYMVATDAPPMADGVWERKRGDSTIREARSHYGRYLATSLGYIIGLRPRE